MTPWKIKFAKEAKAAGMDGLKGHRSVGGIRASVYNAFPSPVPRRWPTSCATLLKAQQVVGNRLAIPSV